MEQGGIHLREEWPETVEEVHSTLQIHGVMDGPDSMMVGNILPFLVLYSVLYCTVMYSIIYKNTSSFLEAYEDVESKLFI